MAQLLAGARSPAWKRLAVALLAVLAVLSARAPASASVRGDYQVIARSGQTVPGFAGDVTLTFLERGAVIGVDGRVVYAANVTDGQTPAIGYWSGSLLTTNLVAMTGQPAPDTGGAKFALGASTPSPGMLDAAAVGIILSSPATPTTDESIWIGASGVSTKVFREGDPTPLAGLRFGSIVDKFADYTAPINPATGDVVFQTGLQNAAGVPLAGAVNWIHYLSATQPITQTGGPVPGFPPTPQGNTTFTQLGSPGITAAGDVFYSGSFAGPSGSGTGIFHADASSQKVVAATGMTVAPGVTFVDVRYGTTAQGTNVHAGGGATVFYARVQGANVLPDVDDQRVFVAPGLGVPVELARQNGAASDLPGVNFASFLDTGMSITGRAGLLAALSGPGVTPANDRGLWVGAPGDLRLFLRNGDTIADGANPPLTVQGLGHFAMNAWNTLVTQLGDQTIVGMSSTGQPTIVARIGDTIQVALGDFRTVEALMLNTGDRVVGGGSALGPSGLVAFSARFTDGSTAVLMSNVLTVPEPAAAVSAVLAAALGALMARRHRPKNR